MKKNLIAWIIPLVIVLIILGFFIWNGYRKENQTFIYIDALTSTGAIAVLFALLLYVTQEGSLDMLIYGTKRFFKSFTKEKDNDDFPKTYLEYVERRRDRPKLKLYPTLIIASIPLILGIILYFVFGLEI